MDKHGIVTIDIGTTSTRALLFDGKGAQLGLARRDNPPTHYPDGRVEQDPLSWSRIVPGILKECADLARDQKVKIDALSLTSLRSSVFPLGRGGDPLSPAIMWQDLRTETIVGELSSQNPFVYARCGMKVTTVMSAPKMAWLKRSAPAVYARAYKLAGIHDYVLLLLTGRLVTDASLASRTNLLNLASRTWDRELIGLFGIDASKLCDMVEPGSVIGGLLPAMAEATGLPSGLPVVSAGGDQQCAALGLGLSAPDRIVANTGTGSYLLAFSEKPVFDPGMRVFCNASALPDAYVVEAGLPASGAIYRWFGENFYDDDGRGTSSQDLFGRLNAEAASSPPGADGLLFLPHFKGSGAPHFNPRARGSFHNLDLSTTRGDLGRAILEGIAAEMADNLEILEALTQSVDRVNSSGGLSGFGLFNRIQADMYGRRVRRSEQGEATALGAWISAAKAVGLYGSLGEASAAAEAETPSEDYLPETSAVEYYGRLRAERRALYDALYPD
jgi:sugar (pentulose or hexulose) kinase